MSIRKSLRWDKKLQKYCDYVNYGDLSLNIEEPNTIAREVIFFMLVCLTKNWRVPIAFFAVDKMSGFIQAELVKVCLNKLEKVQVQTHCYF